MGNLKKNISMKKNFKKRKPVQAAITLIASPTIIRAGDTTSLTGKVTVNGRPAARVVVVFSVADVELGTVIPFITVTNSEGGFKATFRASINEDQPAFTSTFVTAALPSFPGVTATSTVGIVSAVVATSAKRTALKRKSLR